MITDKQRQSNTMSHSQDWDISKHRSPHEPAHHWELKKKFMEHHKDRFPEDILVRRCQICRIFRDDLFQVGLAQTFGNMEFMGCQYPQDTMEQINELSFGIVTEFRENQKGKLKRTFVSGSDAANKKVNRL